MQNTLEKQFQTFKLTEEQELLQKTVRDIAEENFKEKAREIDKTHRFPRENFNLLGKFEMTGLILPVEYGGGGMDYVSYTILIEEIARVCATTSVILAVHLSLFSVPVVKFGSESVKNKYLKKLAKGELLGAFCLSEPGNGSDAAAMLTRAVNKDDHFILNGTKAWITNGSEADLYLVFAQADPTVGVIHELPSNKLPQQKHKGVTAFIVEKNMPGVSFGKLEDKLGIRASSTCQVILDNVKVPKENILGNIGDGFKIAMMTLDSGRIGIAAQALGIAQGSYDLAVSYAKTREAFGKKIITFQAIQFMLAEIATEIEAGRLLIYHSANLKDQGLKYTRQSAEAKLFCSELASKAANKCVQILGGYGYTTEYDAERFMRDAKITEIYEGTSEIQRIVIASNIIKEFTSLTETNVS